MEKICFLSIDVEPDFGKEGFRGVEKLDKILDIFEKHNVPATLFVTGQVLQKYSEAARGWSKHYEIACHGFYHTFWNQLSSEQRKQELEQFNVVYRNMFGQQAKGFRGPSHIIDEPGLQLLQEQGFLYDSSVVPHYPFFKKYRGYQGRAPLSPYCPADDNLRKKGSPAQLFSEKLGGQEMKILEIPLTGQALGLPLAGAWLAKLPIFVYKVIFAVAQPTFLTFNLHSWDALSPKVLVKTDELLTLLKNKGYQFLRGEEIIKIQDSRFKIQGCNSKFKIINNLKEWQELLSKVLFKTFFHSLDWENFLESQFKWLRFERYVYEDSVLLSLARVRFKKREKLISHPFCEYGGPLPLKKDIDFQAFQNALLSEFKTALTINFHPKVLDYFSKINLPNFVRRNTFLIEDLAKRTKEVLWGSLRKTVRQALKKSQEAGLEIKEASDEKELKKFYCLYLKTGKRNKILVYPFSFFSYFWERPNTEIILAKYKDKVIAGSIFLLQKGFVHYFLNASLRRYKDLYPNHLILWHQIVKYLGREERTLDLGGTRAGSLLEVFKSGWGAKKYPIFELTNQPVSEGLRRSPLRKIWGLLPIPLLKILSPYFLRYKI